MDLKNGYKVIYDIAKDDERTFYASKTGVFADAEQITTTSIGEYKLVYEKNGMLYGSTTGIPASTDYCFEAFNKVFVADEPEQENQATPASEPANDPVEVPVEDDTDLEPDGDEPKESVDE